MAKDEKSAAKEQGSDQVVELENGHSLAVGPGGKAVEIRAPGGQVEIRIEMTEAGPVLRAEAAKLEIKAEEDVVIEGKHVSLSGSESVDLDSEGKINITSVKHMRLRGEMIWLN